MQQFNLYNVNICDAIKQQERHIINNKFFFNLTIITSNELKYYIFPQIKLFTITYDLEDYVERMINDNVNNILLNLKNVIWRHNSSLKISQGIKQSVLNSFKNC